jgi:hypothetical protein
MTISKRWGGGPPVNNRSGLATAAPSTWQRACAVFCIALAVYLRTLYPSVAGGDAGELITAAHHLEVVHPPGYPLFTLLAHAFTWIPFGSIAWRVNLFSAVCDAAAAALLFSLGYRLCRSYAAASAGALCFAFAPLIWAYATSAEVFALNNLFAVGLLYGTLATLEAPTGARFAGLAFLFGLALTNHQTILFVGLPLLVGVLVYKREQLLHARPLAAALQD